MAEKLDAIERAVREVRNAVVCCDYADALDWGVTLRLRLAELDALMMTRITNTQY